MKILTVAVVCAVIVFLGVLLWKTEHKPEDKLSLLRNEVEPRGGVVLETQLEGRRAAFLLLRCELFLLDATAKELVRTKVLQLGFHLWPAPCWRQSIRMEDGYLRVYLENRAFGAGGGNPSGGEYRSRDGRVWEKETSKGWRPVAEVQD
ncbi:MAG: hypothetical protein U0R19_08450 [Bryobacteraceae bacterium]